jgi:hypothetical protein
MEKNKRKNPKGIRMPEELVEKIKQKEGLKTDQAVVNFLLKMYEQMVFPITLAPTLDRWIPPEQNPNSDKKSARHKTATPKKEAIIPRNEDKNSESTAEAGLSDFMRKRQQAKNGQ